MAERKKLKKYKMAVGICGPTILYTNIIKAYSAEEAARSYLEENNDGEINDEMVSETAKRMFEIEDEKTLDDHYDVHGKRLEVGDTILAIINSAFVKGAITKLTKRSVKIGSNNDEYTLTISSHDYKEIDGEKKPYFTKIVKITDEQTPDNNVEVDSFVAYMDINFGQCTGFGFGTVTKITPSYIYINTEDNNVIRKSAAKVYRLR